MNAFCASLKNNLIFDDKKTYVMGILNVTPDSFSDAQNFFEPKKALKRAIQMQEEGADIIDIGAQSTRPGFIKIDEKIEWERLSPVLRLVRKRIDLPISIDTFYPCIAEKAIKLGADIINDVTGFVNEKMLNLSSTSNISLICMHNKALNKTRSFFEDSFQKFKKAGIKKEKICFDPGVGFGKTVTENLRIIKNPTVYCPKETFVLVGISRKRVTALACEKNTPANQRLGASIAANIISALNGTNILRVHDVKETVQALKMLKLIKEIQSDVRN
ncbi:MAG: dihydropteroate synthase [Oscillospiraceae bacterium]|jgi:dihydropteroate synthase|nr:dihydropteroate synthase [Oscillospiraceae bacterium]